jgi:hypothetical protein
MSVTPYLLSDVVLNGHLSIFRQRQVRDLLQEVPLIGGQHQDPLALLARAGGAPQPVNVLGPVGWNAHLENRRLALSTWVMRTFLPRDGCTEPDRLKQSLSQ